MKICQICGKEFEITNKHGHSRIYCKECAPTAYKARPRSLPKKATDKNYATPNFSERNAQITRWATEAAACHMDYGNYRAAVEFFGKTFEELSARGKM